jgi:hypothetical protein
MAAPVTECTKEYQWYVIRFLYSEDVTSSEYYGITISQYGDYLRTTGKFTNRLNDSTGDSRIFLDCRQM